jgi:undecaprenyl pyrophosphate phosphatase UppP
VQLFRGATIQANCVQLQQVITNLVVIAIEAHSDGRRSSDARTIRVASCIIGGQVETTAPGLSRCIATIFSTVSFQHRK